MTVEVGRKCLATERSSPDEALGGSLGGETVPGEWKELESSCKTESSGAAGMEILVVEEEEKEGQALKGEGDTEGALGVGDREAIACS